MENTDLIDRITPLFREVFDDDGLVVTPEMTADDIVTQCTYTKSSK